MLPVIIRQGYCATAAGRRTTYVVNQNIQTIETIHYGFYNYLYSFSSTDICLNKTISGSFRRNRSGGRDYVSTTSNQTVNYGLANASGTTCNQNSPALEFSWFSVWVVVVHL